MLGWKGNDFPKEKARHLYVVFDDWAWGYSIRKIDLTDNGDSDLDYHLPPPIFRFQAPRGSPNYFAGAFNSKILAMQPMDSQFSLNPTAGVPVFDVRKRSLMVGPRSDQLHPIYIPIGGRLFALAAGSFQLLYPPSDAKDFVWTWHTLPDPPFEHKHVASYAVHRDGRTMIVSTSGSPTIFSFDTAESVRDASAWKQNGQGQLPFNGRGFFVSELGALVGLNRRPDTRELCICSIDVTSEEWYNVQDVKFCNVDISVPDFVMGTTLVSMGGNKFCVMQCCMERNCLSRYMRLITFSVMYDQNGGLTIGDSCRCRTYINFPKDVGMLMHENPVAFWM